MYTKVSIPKNGDGAGCAIIKDPNIILVDVDDILTEPTRSCGNVETTGDLTLAENAKAIAMYATQSSIVCGADQEGELDAKGFKDKVEFEHPGDSDESENFAEHAANRGFVALVKQCDGTSAGKTKVYGRKCNPLYLSIETTDTKDGAKKKFSFVQNVADKFRPGVYNGTTPELASEPTVNEGEGA